jgi:hybrid cluster-associated redox disulfide protein
MVTLSTVDNEQAVNEVMTLWPASIRVFIDRRMHCVGCPVGGLHSLEEAARAHGIAPDDLIAEIAATTKGPATR